MKKKIKEKYEDIYDQIYENTSLNHDNDLYNTLMNDESEILNKLNILVKKDRLKNLESKELIQLPLKKIFLLFFRELSEILNELINLNKNYNYTNILDILTKKHRIIFIGILFIMISFFLMLIYISDETKK